MTSNPYEPAVSTSSGAIASVKNRRRWAVVGFVLACAPFAALGVYGLYADAQYAATLPPNTPRCGNGALAAMLLIFPVSPFFGSIGAGIGLISAIVCNRVTSNTIASQPNDHGEPWVATKPGLRDSTKWIVHHPGSLNPADYEVRGLTSAVEHFF